MMLRWSNNRKHSKCVGLLVHLSGIRSICTKSFIQIWSKSSISSIGTCILNGNIIFIINCERISCLLFVIFGTLHPLNNWKRNSQDYLEVYIRPLFIFFY